ncbi:unnamed protein product [Miscanthus lutarioriparius]|uniref:Uncharacterized protein n=1 Tax=Miscanthus lutarioriparius TaxID=422564 RepID=A0A811RKD3_9POAL|nr:unnamed protein product [Miscanthus lutarioriparius]
MAPGARHATRWFSASRYREVGRGAPGRSPTQSQRVRGSLQRARQLSASPTASCSSASTTFLVKGMVATVVSLQPRMVTVDVQDYKYASMYYSAYPAYAH